MKKSHNEREIMREFAEFIEAGPVAPGKTADAAVLNRVENDLHPALWKVYAKFGLIEIAAGLATLSVCPQFGVGFGRHNELLHTIHTATSPFLFHLLCGLLFVIFGAALSGLVLNRNEIRVMGAGPGRFLYFSLFGLLAYLSFMALGAEGFVAASLAWVPGALLGNIIGFETVARLRQAGPYARRAD